MRGGVLAVATLMAAPAAAEPLRTARIVAAGACDMATLDVRSNELLGRTAIFPQAAAQVGIFAAEDEDRFSATLTFVDVDGVAQPARTVSAATCEELVESLAVVISLVLRPEAAPPRPAPAPEPAPPPPERPAPSASADDRLYEPRSLARTNIAVELGAAGGSSGESALVIGGRLERTRSALVADLRVTAPDTLDLGSGSVHVVSGQLDLGGCVHARGFGACALVMAGLVRARGEDLMDARSAVRPIAAVGARIEWRQYVTPRLGLRVFADVEQLLATTRFLVDDMPVWTSDPRQAWLGAGIYLRLP